MEHHEEKNKPSKPVNPDGYDTSLPSKWKKEYIGSNYIIKRVNIDKDGNEIITPKPKSEVSPHSDDEKAGC